MKKTNSERDMLKEVLLSDSESEDSSDSSSESYYESDDYTRFFFEDLGKSALILRSV